MLAAAKDKLEQEKQWLLSKIGLIPDHDDGEYPGFRILRMLAELSCLTRCDGRTEVEFLLLAIATGT